MIVISSKMWLTSMLLYLMFRLMLCTIYLYRVCLIYQGPLYNNVVLYGLYVSKRTLNPINQSINWPAEYVAQACGAAFYITY